MRVYVWCCGYYGSPAVAVSHRGWMEALCLCERGKYVHIHRCGGEIPRGLHPEGWDFCEIDSAALRRRWPALLACPETKETWHSDDV